MKEKGISFYPMHATVKENCAYIEKAAHFGFTRAFTCLLSIDTSLKKDIMKEFKQTIQFAQKCGLKVIADITPDIFQELGVSYDDLTFFNDLGVWGIRLDLGFSGNEEAFLSFNPFNLKIELNISNDIHYLDMIMDFQPNPYNLLGSYNFYPHRYTGLSRKFVEQCGQRFRKYGISMSAFVKAPSADLGPWPVSDGLCTLEEHRSLPLTTQVKDMFFNLGIETVLIGESFASDDELKSISAINPFLLELHVELIKDLPDIERSIVLDNLHNNRGDQGEFLIRSTQSRLKYKNNKFPAFNTPPEIKKGDILIDSSKYGHYAGELQIALQNMKNSGRTNIVGHIRNNEILLLDFIKPWQKFKLIV